jgi:hypothetical protein
MNQSDGFSSTESQLSDELSVDMQQVDDSAIV